MIDEQNTLHNPNLPKTQGLYQSSATRVNGHLASGLRF